MIPAAFEYHAPTTLQDALALLRRHKDDAKLMAGGHSLVPMMKLRLAQPAHLIDLGGIAGLAYVREEDGGLAIGPMTTYYEIYTSSLVQRLAPTLAEGAAQVADVQVRNKGTIGGSLAHADPAGDLPAVALALEARIQTTGGGRARSIAADRFFLDVLTTALKETEVITEVRVPSLPQGTGGSYQKFANKASHFAIVGVAAVVTVDRQGVCQKVRIGITGAGPVASRAKLAERYLQGKEASEGNVAAAAQRASKGLDFNEDIHGSAEYREHLTKVFTRRALTEAIAKARG